MLLSIPPTKLSTFPNDDMIVYNFIGAFDFDRTNEKAQNTTKQQQRTA